MQLTPLEFLNQTQSPFQREARASDICLGCGGSKQPGTMVCWDCFKDRADTTPFKYSNLSLEKWLEQLPTNL